jgi:predicted nucleic acid-binding protein
VPVRRDILLDTGPLVAVIDAADQWHERCASLWMEVAERCVTTEAVVAEASDLVGRAGAPSLPLELLVAARIPVVTLERAGHEHAVRLMRRYGDLPMDYADATLVVAGDALRLETVFTMDRKGFRAYRLGTGAGFTLIPGVDWRP